MNTATEHPLTPNLQIRIVSAPYFLGTKIEAFRGRGSGDYFASHDLEDMILIDGRSTIVSEVEAEAAPLRDYLRTQTNHLLATPEFVDALPAEFQGRAEARRGLKGRPPRSGAPVGDRRHEEEKGWRLKESAHDGLWAYRICDGEFSIPVIRASCEETSRGDDREGRQIPDP